MAVGAEDLIELLRSIVAANVGDREAGAENASDLATVFDREEAGSVVLVLANMASVETNSRVREAQLHAIREISDTHPLRGGLVSSLGRLISDDLNEEQLSYLNELGLGLGVGKGTIRECRENDMRFLAAASNLPLKRQAERRRHVASLASSCADGCDRGRLMSLTS
ncbi:hypothetical protein KRMM14A1259_43980 [Krasilnikovia sp. MM14-A1259]